LDFIAAENVSLTASEIFIPPPMLSVHRIEDGQTVAGTAVKSFNKKWGNWGWKALSIEKV
jgi:hypothetical protein